MQNRKRILFSLMLTLSILLLTACSGNPSPAGSEPAAVSGDSSAQAEEPTESTPAESAAPETSAAQNGVLVAYFTRNGNTDSNFPEGVDAVARASLQKTESGTAGNAEQMANWIAEATGGELFAIRTEEQYPADYDETVSQAQEEQTAEARPALSTHLEDPDRYQTIVLVYPNWWADLPMPVYSFLEEYDFSGKQIVAYCTHGGSGFSDTVSTIQTLEPDATVTEGAAISDSAVADAKEEIVSGVTAWLPSQTVAESDNSAETTITLTIGDKSFPVTLADNDTAEAFAKLLPKTMDMEELNGNEKYFDLDRDLPSDAVSVGQIEAGDLMLYGSNCVVLFYDSFDTTYSYTRIGTVTDPTGLREAVGTGSATVSFAR